ncbi:MAG TPA: hypothetical protein PLJ18_11595 [Niabella sp.]|nr:hypothetical protein [Bacteroidia bacterium]HRB52073.1 hypothetical protein [Bacteroidia bacterium]HRC03090.1 hypothetical protein [Niabella sp.]
MRTFKVNFKTASGIAKTYFIDAMDATAALLFFSAEALFHNYDGVSAVINHI